MTIQILPITSQVRSASRSKVRRQKCQFGTFGPRSTNCYSEIATRPETRVPDVRHKVVQGGPSSAIANLRSPARGTRTLPCLNSRDAPPIRLLAFGWAKHRNKPRFIALAGVIEFREE